MKNIEKKDKIQKEALNYWIKSGKKGTVRIITGLGKTFVGLHALYEMPLDKNITHLFLAEVVDRKKDLLKQIKLYNEIFNRDVLNDYNLEFYCYQTVYKWENKSFGLVIADEIPDSLTKEYSKFYKNNNYDSIIGLTAFVDKEVSYELNNNSFITKGILLDKIAPICYDYDLNTAREENTTRELEIRVIRNTLNNVIPVVKSGSKNKPFYQTETKAYDYWDKRFNKALYIEDSYPNGDPIEVAELKEREIRLSARKRSEILYSSIHKIENTKKLLRNIKGKTLLFSNSIDSLLQITPNVVSSRNKEDVNEAIRDRFDKGEINVIGSFKKLKQGANLEELDNVIMMSYYGVKGDFIQRTGRLRDNGEIGYLFIFLTKNTQEEVWFNKMTEGLTNFNIKYYKTIDECLNDK